MHLGVVDDCLQIQPADSRSMAANEYLIVFLAQMKVMLKKNLILQVCTCFGKSRIELVIEY